MLALQNVEHILIQASPFLDFQSAKIHNISLDTAVEAPGQPASARGIELCSCPPEYNSTSCQDPSLGFYRWYSGDSRQATIIIQLVGEARPCQCNGRSQICDIETGHCLKCSHNTGGPHCERCAEGFYGDPDVGPCQSCPCPSPHRNFAVSCQVTSNQVMCHCKSGYTGSRCERCAYGYYGFPREEGGICVPCKCNPYGSVSDECDEETGQCNCNVGITGRDCSYCQDRHILTEFGCQSCNDSCTGVLLSEVEELASRLAQNTHHLVEGDIPPPWQSLHNIRDAAMRLEKTLQEWLDTISKVDNFPESQVEDLRRKAKQLLNKAKKIINHGSKNIDNSLIVRHEAQRMLDDIVKLHNDTNDVVQGLKNYGQTGAGEVSVARALREAQHLASEIRKRNSTINSMKEAALQSHEHALSKCGELMEIIEELQKRVPKGVTLHKSLDMLKSRLDSLLESLNDTFEVLAKTKSLDNKTKEILKTQKMNIDSIWDIGDEIEALADDVKFLMENAKSFLENATANMDLLKENMKSLANVTKQLTEREGILARINPLYREQYVLKAQQHADMLYERAQRYRDLFNSTRRDADFALRASKAYQNIVDALKTSKESAINASFAGDVAFKLAFPSPHQTSLVQQSRSVEEQSGELIKRSQQELSKIKNIRDDFDNANSKLDNVRLSVKNTEKENNQILQELKKLNSNPIQRNAEEAMLRAESALKMSQETNARAAKVSNDVKNKLRPMLAALSEDELLSTHTKKLMAAQRNIEMIKKLLENMNQKANEDEQNFNKWNNTIAEKLHTLRSEITKARHTAEGIQVSLTSRANGGCVRSYRLHNLTPSTTNTIVLNYAVHTTDKDAALFYLSDNSSQEFMALEMVNRKIRFVWNAGGGAGVVVHPLKIEKAVLEEDKNWYRIKVQRTSNVATLSVRQQILPPGFSTSGDPVSNSSTPGFGIVDVKPGDFAWVGGLPPGVVVPPQLLAPHKGLEGCLHRVVLDGRPLGLWNFATETKDSCTACISGVEETKDESVFKFEGDGYSIHPINSYDSAEKFEFSITLKFKTFDENSVLFIAVDEAKARFVALILENGHLVFHIGYGSNINMLLRTMKPVNTGAWIHCEASRAFQNGLEKALLSVRTSFGDEDEGEEENIQRSPTELPSEDDLPELHMYFLGGVPPGFKLYTSSLRFPLHFLGCMTEILVFNEGVNPLAGKFYGVEASCTESYTTVSFHGRGFLQLLPHPLKKKESSFEFVFRTRQRNAFLMLTEGSEDEDYYAVSLKDGRIVVWVSRRGTKTVQQTNKVYNDGEFHSISVTKKNKKLTLRVDEEDLGTVIMQGADYQVKTSGPERGLIFGGVPPNKPRLHGMIASNISLIGTVKDAIFNNHLLHFEQHVMFSHADIGRLEPWQFDETEALSVAMTNLSFPTKCNDVDQHAIESNSVKFGDISESYVLRTLKPESLQNNFIIKFSFRTFYPNGLLLFVPGQRKNLYFMVALRNKQLFLEVKGRKKANKLTGKSELNDGSWHNIMIERNEKQLLLTINQKLAVKFRRRLPAMGSAMYLGGLPSHHKLTNSLETFKGCIRQLVINEFVEQLVQPDSQSKNVRQCFSSVERGAYFSGDAYAIYDKEFQIKSLQELELEFKTSELTGILLSVAESSGSRAISLELYNGKIVMRSDSGDGKPLQVEQGYLSNYSLCDNKWHSIRASFLNNGLLLKVDSLPNVTGLPYNDTAVTSQKRSFLYIGGVPRNATGGTLKTREYFKGCIRNIVIGQKLKDWTDMAMLENVHLNSCPLRD